MQPDLNLLIALDMLLEEETVQAAADRLNLSSPAMSRTLGRLRTVTQDPILVRTGRTMTPTPYAVSVRDQVQLLVQEARALLLSTRDLDLVTLRQTFTVQCHDAVLSAIAPALLTNVQLSAPAVTLRLLGEESAERNDLRHGRVDLIVGSTTPAPPDTSFQTLGVGRFVVALRRGHPLQTNPSVLEGYAEAEHVIVSRRGRLSDPVDTALAARGLSRRVIAAAPTSFAAMRIVSDTDVVTTVPETFCRHLIDLFGLDSIDVPFELPPIPLVFAWHQRFDTDPAHVWLRQQVRQTLSKVSDQQVTAISSVERPPDQGSF